MKLIIVTLFFSLFPLFADTFTNALIDETSPYLQQHAHNPVNWMPWGKAAFIKAKKENKPIFLSIGYATCHWCHVMEKESFTKRKIAALLNKYFIPVKVDREELPQIDALYQRIYKSYYGHSGGWPLNLFLTPQKQVFYITTYIPTKTESYAEGFTTLLPKMNALYNNKLRLKNAIEEIAHAAPKENKNVQKILTTQSLVDSIQKMYDTDYPGFGTSKQFPEAAKITLLLDLAQLTKNKKLAKEYFTLLDTMALRGIYDQVGGGFFRYSVDREWEIPHFEKMLYTQADLIVLYVRGYALSHKRLYKDVVQESIAMLQKHFSWHNLYFSASDADTKKGEGAYFTFTPKEIDAALKYNVHEDDIRDALGLVIEENFHERVHLNFYTNTRPKGFYYFQKALREIQSKHTYPFIDKKINTAWNAMMIATLYKAAYIDEKYAKMADKSLFALEQMMLRKQELYHQTIPNHQPQQKGLLEDYAFFIAALLASYEQSYDIAKLQEAEYLLAQAKQRFYKSGVWYLSSKKQIKAGVNDKYYTAAVSKMVQNIIRIAVLKESLRYDKFAQKSLNTLQNELPYKLADAPALARAYLMHKNGVVLLKSKKSNLLQNRKKIQAIEYPYIMTRAEHYDDFLACDLRQCFAKEKNLEKIIFLIYKKKI
ncbi:Thymidylate kinase [hydrothermal vent metagenome]|uniref:Thymidylate kinase n=1 Tax=hydrothermal vent metagenome TaxID=652676 RepID=A0A1W1CW78_9ZZZZ